MKKLSFSVLLSFLFFFGCNKDNPVNPPDDGRVSFEISFLEYSDNSFFIDEVYTDTSKALNLYNKFYGEPNPEIVLRYIVKNFEVYISAEGSGQIPGLLEANAYIDLPSRSSASLYSDSLRNNNLFTQGLSESGKFRLLSEGSDYLFHRQTGYIKFLIPITEQQIIAAAYSIENDSDSELDDLIYGEFISELINNAKTRCVLKLIKPSNLQAQHETAWKLKMKNFYQIAPNPGAVTDLDLDIYLRKKDGTDVNTVNNFRLLELFGLDKYSENGKPDGKFDNIINRNFKPETSELIFPVIQPFGKNIPFPLKDYKYQLIYDTSKAFLFSPENVFVIKGKYKPV